MDGKLPLIVIELAKDMEGIKFYRTNDTYQEVPRKAIRVLSEPPALLRIRDNYPFNERIDCIGKIPEGANALILGTKRVRAGNESEYVAASYCHLDLSQLEKQEIIPGIDVHTLASEVID